MVETFSIVTIVAIAIQAIALIVLHLLPTGYDSRIDAVGDYGIGKYRALGSTVEHRAAWHGVKGWLEVLPWVMVSGAVGTLVAMRARLKRVGLFERLFCVASIVWIGPAAIGPLAVAAFAIGALAIGRVVIANAVIRKLSAGGVEIRSLKVGELEVGGHRWPQPTASDPTAIDSRH